MTFQETIARAVEIYKAQEKKNLPMACHLANEEAGGEWNVSGIQTRAFKIIFA